MTPARISRRQVLAGAAATLALPQLSACTRGRGQRLEVVVVWSGGELERFRDAIAAYSRETGQTVDVTSGGDDIDQFLSARESAGNLPDLAVLSRPGLLPCYVERGWVQPVDDIVGDLDRAFTGPWREILRVQGRIYGVWVKAAHKSLFWKRPEAPVEPSRSWGDFIRQTRRLAETSDAAPMAIGAGDGWVLTDWIENLLVSRTDPDTYAALARGEERWDDSDVEAAFEDLFALWRIDGLLPHSAGRALLTQWEESVMEVFARGSALTVLEGDFVFPVAQRFAALADRPIDLLDHPFSDVHVRFPSATGIQADEPLLVGGDFAVLMNDSDDARALLRSLIEPDRFASWLGAGGYLIPNKLAHAADHYNDRGFERDLGAALVDEDARLRFDLSDLLPPQLGGADGLGLWKVMQDFFRDATRPGARRDDVVGSTTRRLNDAARRYRAAGEAGDACP